MPAIPSAANQIPGPLARFGLGRPTNQRLFERDPIGAVIKAQHYGTLSALVLHDPSWIVALGPDHNRRLLAEPHLFQAPEAPRTSATDRLLSTLRGQQPPASLAIEPLLPAFDALISDEVDGMLDRWGVSQPIDIRYVMRHLALRIAMRIVLGLTLDEAPQLGRLLDQWSGRLSTASPLLLPHRRSPLWQRWMQQSATQIEHALLKLIAQRHPTATPNLLSHLIAGYQQDHAAIVANAIAYFVAIHELSASAMSWTILLLADHPRIWSDLQAAQRERTIGASRSAPSEAFPLLERVINESLRLLPPVGVALRQCAHATELGGYAIPAGAIVIYSPYITHRVANLFVTPQRFRPERWLYIEPALSEFMPFGAEPALLQSAPLVMQVVKRTLAPLIRRFRLVLAPGITIDRGYAFGLVPKPGLPMIITPPDRHIILRRVAGNVREMVAFS